MVAFTVIAVAIHVLFSCIAFVVWGRPPTEEKDLAFGDGERVLRDRHGFEYSRYSGEKYLTFMGIIGMLGFLAIFFYFVGVVSVTLV